MKRKFAAILMTALLLTGCGVRETARTQGQTDAVINQSADQAGSVRPETARAITAQSENPESEPAPPENESETSFPGVYTVPDGWVRAEKYSTDEKIFYVMEGHETDDLPDNISINIGTNRYSAEEHEDFRDAILRQLMAQVKSAGAELAGDGSYTEQGYPVYVFTIGESGGAVTRQYYIVKDYGYCLIHLSNYTGSDSADEAAQAMADSFVWNGSE